MFNKDGTKYDPPKSLLKEKWDRLYPPVPKPEYSQVCDGYSCMWCGRCPSGNHWEVPDDDKAEYYNWRKQVEEYITEHNGADGIGGLWFSLDEL